jgi:hypothetical protein
MHEIRDEPGIGRSIVQGRAFRRDLKREEILSVVTRIDAAQIGEAADEKS